MTVQRILDTKGSRASTIDPGARIVDVVAMLEVEDVGTLVVSGDGRRIDGIISERDVVRGLQSIGSKVLEHQVRDLMTSDVFTCTAKDRVAGVMAMMIDRGIRHVPVVKEGKLAGIVSIQDIVRLRLDEVQDEANAMREYIAGGR